MARAKWLLVSAGSLGVALAATTGLAERAPVGSPIAFVSSHDQAATPAAKPTQAPAAAAATQPLDTITSKFCINCHNEELKRGDLSLVNFDLAKAAQNAEVVEKMIRKLQAGMMPLQLFGERRTRRLFHRQFGCENIHTRHPQAREKRVA